MRLFADSELPEQTKLRSCCGSKYIKGDNLGSETSPRVPDNLQPKISLSLEMRLIREVGLDQVLGSAEEIQWSL